MNRPLLLLSFFCLRLLHVQCVLAMVAMTSMTLYVDCFMVFFMCFMVFFLMCFMKAWTLCGLALHACSILASISMFAFIWTSLILYGVTIMVCYGLLYYLANFVHKHVELDHERKQVLEMKDKIAMLEVEVTNQEKVIEKLDNVIADVNKKLDNG